MNSYQTEYLQTWKVAFAQFLGWSEERTVLWAKPLIADLEEPGMVLNEPPLYYVAREMASRQPFYDELTQRERHDLIRTVEFALSPDRDFPEGFDFSSARMKIEKIFASHK